MWPKISIRTRITAILLLGMLSYICIKLVGDANLGQRRVFIRYWNCLVCGFFAIAVPHLLFPDAKLYLIQTINLGRRQLLIHQFRKLGVVFSVTFLPVIILVFYDLEDVTRNIFDGMILLVESWLFLFGIGCYAFQKFASIGQLSQEWREGKRGKIYRHLRIKMQAERVPTMIATVSITFWGMHLIVLGTYLSHVYQFDLEWLSGFLLLGWSAVRMALKIKAYDRHFYCTNAFYGEAFKDPSVFEREEHESVAYASLYWVPRRWRPHVWAGLLQLDGRLPLAVFMVLGHIFLWLLFYLHTSDAFITAYLLLFIVAKNGASYPLATQSVAPIYFQMTLQSPTNWVITRFFINLRWTFLFVLNLPLIAWMWETFTLFDAINWVGIDLFLAFLSALLFTYFHETQFKKRYV